MRARWLTALLWASVVRDLSSRAAMDTGVLVLPAQCIAQLWQAVSRKGS